MTAPGMTDPDNDLRVPSAEEDGAAEGARIPEAGSVSDESEETADDGSSFASGGRRPTREELESKYRQDPRFTMQIGRAHV